MGAYEQAAEARMAAAKKAAAEANASAVDEQSKKAAAAAALAAAPKPSPATTAYADLTPTQRAAMTQSEKTDYLAAARAAKMAEEAAARAASDPMLNFAERPEAPQVPGKIQYYSWIGGVNNGQWKLYSAPENPITTAMYGDRAAGGATGATPNSAVGANTLVTPNMAGVADATAGLDTNAGLGIGAANTPTPTPTPTPTGKKEKSRVDNGDGTFTITYDDGSTEVTGTKTTPKAPVGTPPAYIYDPVTKTWVMPPKPTGAGNWVFDANKGWVDTTVVPGPTGLRADGTQTLAIDTFRNTLALLFGPKEASQPWVTALFDSASKFYNSGSTIDEAINLSLQDIRYNAALKPFTDRFNGIYALTDRLAKGEAITVPTVAEYFKSEAAMGDVLRAAGMGDLANQNFLGGIIGLGKSVLEVTNLITDTFDRIDNAPSALKADLQAFFPGADRTSIAKAMLLGDKGAAELTKKVKAISVMSAAKTQGITVSDLTSEDLAGQGYDYNESLTNFATVKQLERGQTLGRMSNIDFTQQEAIASTFQSNAAAAEKIRRIKEEETNRFSGTSGRLASQTRAQGLI